MNSLLNWIEFETKTHRGGRKVCKLGNIVTEYPLVLVGGYSSTFKTIARKQKYLMHPNQQYVPLDSTIFPATAVYNII